MITVQSAGGQPLLGGAGAVLEIRSTQEATMANVVPGTGGWTDGGIVRYGSATVSLPGVNGWANGSGGSTPVRGYVSALGAPWMRARNNGAGNVPIDWYCGVMCAPIVQRPAVPIPQAFSVYEVGCHMALSTTPAAPITRDCGLVFIMSANTAYANVLRAGVAPGNDFAGFGVVFDGLGDLRWIVKKNGAGGGAPLTESVLIGSPGPQRIVPVKVRMISADVGTEARVEVYTDGILRITRNWGAGTVLPVAADATFSAQMGTFRAMMRAGQETATNVELLFRSTYLKAAPNVALLD